MHFFFCLVLAGLASFSLHAADVKAEIKKLSTEPSFVSDDGSIIRNMPRMGEVESVHCSLPPQRAIQASRHKTVSQIWYTISGKGELWLKDSEGVESIVPLQKGVGITVPLGFSFQFRNTGKKDLQIFIVNTTPWSGSGELIPVENHWPLK